MARPGGHAEPAHQRFHRTHAGGTAFDVIDPRPLPLDGMVALEAPKGTCVVLHGPTPTTGCAATPRYRSAASPADAFPAPGAAAPNGLCPRCYPAVVDETSEMRSKLEAQRAYFASDDRIRDRAALWLDATPAQCLEAVYECCEEAAFFLGCLDPVSLDRALAPTPIPADTEALLTRLWNSRKP